MLSQLPADFCRLAPSVISVSTAWDNLDAVDNRASLSAEQTPVGRGFRLAERGGSHET